MGHRGPADNEVDEVVGEARAGGSDYKPLVQELTLQQWAWKVFPVAAASGLEVSTAEVWPQSERFSARALSSDALVEA